MSSIPEEAIKNAFCNALSSPRCGVADTSGILEKNPLIGDISGGNTSFCDSLYAALQDENKANKWRLKKGEGDKYTCAVDKKIAVVYEWYKGALQ